MTGILSKLFTAVRGAATEVGEDIVDSQAERILDQEMREATVELDEAKSKLAALMGEKKGVEREIDELKSNIAEYEQTVAGALEQDNEGLALRVADRIAGLEEELVAKQEAFNQYEAAVAKTRRAIRTSENSLETMRRQVSVAKATERAQQVSVAAAARYSGSQSKMGSARDSLKRIQERQRKRQDQMDAAAQIAGEEDGSDLDREIREAGLKGGGTRSADSVLERIKARKAAGAEGETQGAE